MNRMNEQYKINEQMIWNEQTNQNGEMISLSSLLEVGPVVLFFYPKAMTPG